MRKIAVIGCGFGDEGKGKVVSFLCSQLPKPLVIRYCGGQQAGHHVVLHDGEHVFSNFGSGSLQGHSTYWSKYCCIDPVGILNEYDVLLKKGIVPTLFIDERCPVTTPYDKIYNKMKNDSTQHGSCGVGIGKTFEREEDHYSITAFDLLHPSILAIKFDLLKQYYPKELLSLSYIDNNFLDVCQELINNEDISIIRDIPSGFSDWIFEGSQGLLLDQHNGFFPHVTRANTGTKNILEIIDSDLEIYLVTRAYQTRHGNGPMTNTHLQHNIKPNPYENNFSHTYQGEFRISILDLDLLKYAIEKDFYISQSPNVSLAITCLDLIQECFEFTKQGKLFSFKTEDSFIDAISNELRIKKVFLSRNPFPEMDLVKQ